jgi:hypothetical protein
MTVQHLQHRQGNTGILLGKRQLRPKLDPGVDEVPIETGRVGYALGVRADQLEVDAHLNEVVQVPRSKIGLLRGFGRSLRPGLIRERQVEEDRFQGTSREDDDRLPALRNESPLGLDVIPIDDLSQTDVLNNVKLRACVTGDTSGASSISTCNLLSMLGRRVRSAATV